MHISIMEDKYTTKSRVIRYSSETKQLTNNSGEGEGGEPKIR